MAEIHREKLVETGEISESIDRGKHVTTHRELIVFENGILIDNPGMREVGITDAADGLEMTFEEILTLSQDCKYNDCTHTNEDGCAVLDALESDELNAESYENFLKMEKKNTILNQVPKKEKRKERIWVS